jgi:hypothetical protein
MTLGGFQKAMADLESGTCTEVPHKIFEQFFPPAVKDDRREPVLETIETALRADHAKLMEFVLLSVL